MGKTVIYGIGRIGKKYIDQCMLCEITDLKLVDSNADLWGTEYRGMKICDPESVMWQEYELIVISVGDIGSKYSKEILDRLVNAYKVPREKIADWRETIVLSGKESYNLGNMVLSKEIDRGIIFTGKKFGNNIKEETLNDLERFYFDGEHKTLNKWMHYFEAYDRFFSRYRGKDITVLEIGVFKGGSLQMWKNYFKTSANNVHIYGIDVDPDCKKWEEDGIKIFIGSQEDREFLRKVREEIGEVDILIDDGGHTMNQQIVTFEELFDLVADDGVYLCEDLHTSYMENYGGSYKGKTFIEYSKNLIDYLHAQYSETDQLRENKYSKAIKFITYCDSMVFIEKKKKTTKSICACI